MTKFEISELRDAVEAGVIDAATAERLAAYLRGIDEHGNNLADEEQFRLITSFNDIFVTIGIALFLGALWWLANSNSFISFATVAAASWGLAEVFTRRRRMALPSIVLLITFVGSVLWTAFFLCQEVLGQAATDKAISFVVLFVGIIGVSAAVMHWIRFQVPITIAAGAAVLAGSGLALLSYKNSGLITDHPSLTVLPFGFATLAAAFWFDSSDRLRQTRRTDIAFWLHLLAAPLIVHPIVYPLTVGEGLNATTAAWVIALFAAMSVVALVIDRRALLVSSLTYFGYAAYQMIKLVGLQDQGTALATLIVGAIVLLLSVGWQTLRRVFVSVLPGAIQNNVPPLKV